MSESATCDLCGAAIPAANEWDRTHWNAEMCAAPLAFHPLYWTFCIPCGFKAAEALNQMCRTAREQRQGTACET